MSRLPGGGGEQVDSQQVGPVARPDVDTPMQHAARGAFQFRCLDLNQEFIYSLNFSQVFTSCGFADIFQIKYNGLILSNFLTTSMVSLQKKLLSFPCKNRAQLISTAAFR